MSVRGPADTDDGVRGRGAPGPPPTGGSDAAASTLAPAAMRVSAAFSTRSAARLGPPSLVSGSCSSASPPRTHAASGVQPEPSRPSSTDDGAEPPEAFLSAASMRLFSSCASCFELARCSGDVFEPRLVARLRSGSRPARMAQCPQRAPRQQRCFQGRNGKHRSSAEACAPACIPHGDRPRRRQVLAAREEIVGNLAVVRLDRLFAAWAMRRHAARSCFQTSLAQTARMEMQVRIYLALLRYRLHRTKPAPRRGYPQSRWL